MRGVEFGLYFLPDFLGSLDTTITGTPVPRHAYRIGAPGAGWYEEILNTDAGIYGGGNIGNWGGMHADQIGWQGRSHSLCLTLPPLSTIGFRRHEYK
jgi:1,4-alpha-glucan branching enzyme